MDTVGKKVRELREQKDWTQVQLGVYAGISPSTVNLIEHGHRNPNAVTLQKLADALGVEPGVLFGEPAPKAQPSLFNGSEQRREEEEGQPNWRRELGEFVLWLIQDAPSGQPIEEQSDAAIAAARETEEQIDAGARMGISAFVDEEEVSPEVEEALAVLRSPEVKEALGVVLREARRAKSGTPKA